ncbi:MAG: HI0074 family nucleotidyltransferase substrate-binding subunit [Acidimicrobiaceae bacterium]|nr:HI0074 family nucleotidyltransferase substrate-binding subunit [Acidimicrobiaceae bacterium]
MSAEPSDIDYSKFTQSLLRLEEQHHHLAHDTDELPEWVVDSIKESVIQRFETCYDSCWKLVRRYLIQNIRLPDVPNGPNPVLRLAAENFLLGGELSDWMTYSKARNDTSHDYSKEKADACLAIVDAFIPAAVKLHENLTGQSWTSAQP